MLSVAAAEFMNAVYSIRDADEEAFYNDPNTERAYRTLWKTLERSVPKDVAWGRDVYECCMAHAEWIREKHPEKSAAIKTFTEAIESLLKTIIAIDWIAFVPMERVFRSFPEFSDYNAFSIVNPASIPHKTTEDLLHSFRTIIETNLDVKFDDSPEAYYGNSFNRLGDHFYRKSGAYIPGRPMLVIKTGRGEESKNSQILSTRLHEIVPLIKICQIDIDLNTGILDRIIGAHSTLPDGQWMNAGLIAVPSVAVAINKNNGNCTWWGTRLSLFESQVGVGYGHDRFKKTWDELAAPILALRNENIPQKLRSSLDNAIRMVAQCRHSDMGDLTLNCVIATETILNPFNPAGDISERFSLMISSLTETEADKRRDKYRTAKDMYRYRCGAVHRSEFRNANRRDDEHRKAFAIFCSVLKAVATWAAELIAKDEKPDQAAFDKFYIETVIH